MIFKIEQTAGDTCGNEWIEGESEYLEGKSISHAWEKLGKPRVTKYHINGRDVDCIRTPKGQGYGIWEDNPNFNWNRDKNKATLFETGGFAGIRVEPIKVRK